MMALEVNNDGIRIDKYLVLNTEYTRSKIQKMINDGDILVNGRQIKTSYVVHDGDEIEIIYKQELSDITPENIPLDIIYEDDYLLVVNKPSGMVVHPAPGNYSGTLVNALMYHCNKLSSVNGDIRPGIVQDRKSVV